ncbi:hypothetical protein FRC10_008781 [Ceratobasidium sp. 414]|nr:hypothetical protein FRC10_008781 [Ceratobasidium sp. 414]
MSYQLARLSRPFRCVVSSALEQNPEVYNQPIDEQFKRLIAVPFQNVGHTFGVDVVIVIDALEECEDKDGVNQMLDACFEVSSALPVRFLITSRQNPGILDRMRASQGMLGRAELRLHEVDRQVARKDVRTYLSAGLEHLGLSDSDLECLAKRSGGGGSFIYAASGDLSGGVERLKRLLDIASHTKNTNNQHIDTIYTATLEEALDNSDLDKFRKAEIVLVLRTAACTREPLTLQAIAELLRLDFPGLMNTTLHLLLPTLRVSDTSGLGITLHETFSKYLMDPQRSGEFHCNSERDNVLLQLCFHLIGASRPPSNTCNLDSSYLLDREVVDIDVRVNEGISQGLWYASRHWGTHLALAEVTEDLLTRLHDFLSRRLLLWVEIMDLKGQMPGAAELLHSVHMWLQEVECPINIRDLAADAWMFVEAFSSSGASESTPYIYVFALGFWPADRPVSMHYMPTLENVVKSTGVWVERREEVPIILDAPVTMNVHSPRGFESITRRVGSNPYHWHVGAGQPVGAAPIGHTESLVAYSPDGAYLASSSYYWTVRIQDAHTGQRVGQPLRGHKGEIKSVAYSPDGAYIASGSSDRTIRIWDARTGKPVGQPLNDHTGRVNSVSYSPDGAYITSGSSDKTIRIWDTNTGQRVGPPLHGHTGAVLSVSYSPNGARIASGSSDRTIRIWDAHTGNPVGQPLNGHTDEISSVAYSPDGAYIASGSWDKTIRIWGAHTGKSVGQLLNGHTGWVEPVAYSPDGAYIASGSSDGAVRIWDARTGKPVGLPLNGHTDGINSVAYSPDGAYIASGSWDKTIRIWDSHPRNGVQLPEALSQPIRSPNRSLIPSALAHYITRVSRKPSSIIDSSHLLACMCTNFLAISSSLTNSPQTSRYRSPHSTITGETLPHHWVLNDGGWVVNSYQERFIWVPHDLREFIVLVPTLMVIPLDDHVLFDFRDAKLGTKWRGCFDSSQLCI